jgi:ABC-type nitrate/sulfonate/bicarbonate transport system permease component
MTAPAIDTTPPRRFIFRSVFQNDAAVRIVAGIAILLLWEIGVRLLAPPFVARPSGIIAVLPKVLSSAEFWMQARATLVAVFQGLAIAFVTGTVVGVAIGRIRFVDRFTSVYVSALFAVPMTAILPLFSLWFGFTSDARLATVVFASFFSIVVNVSDGARAVPPEFIEVSRSFRGGVLSRLFEVILPASTPYLLAGLRLAAGRALIGAVVAEFFTTIPGLGFYILFQARTFHHNEAFVGVLVLAGAGVLFETLLRSATSHFLPWYRRGEPGG